MSDPTVTGPALAGTPPKTATSPKVIFGALFAFILPLLIAALISLLTALAGDLHWILDGLPELAQALILSAASSLSAWLGGYLKRDALREEGARYVARRALEE